MNDNDDMAGFWAAQRAARRRDMAREVAWNAALFLSILFVCLLWGFS